jgi:hypothetical protein
MNTHLKNEECKTGLARVWVLVGGGGGMERGRGRMWSMYFIY